MTYAFAPDGAGLYIHIPFCISRCGYCSFVSSTNLQQAPQYLQALEQEMQLRADDWRDVRFSTIYIGGGTPSVLDTYAVERILAALRRHFLIAESAEITVEANPESVDMDKLISWNDTGVNRLSMGLQAGQDSLLQLLGRAHNVHQFFAAVSMARHAGFKHIGGDLIYGLPAQTMADWAESVSMLVQSGVEHISCYALQLEKGTDLHAMYMQNKWPAVDEDLVADMDDAAQQWLLYAGIQRYEISNYAQSGCQSRHNCGYWLGRPYLALGAGAHGLAQDEKGWKRYANHSDIGAYMQYLQGRDYPQAPDERLTQQQRMIEAVMLRTRMTRGLETDLFLRQFGIPFAEAFPQAIETSICQGLAGWEDGFFRPTPLGLALQNRLALLFLFK